MAIRVFVKRCASYENASATIQEILNNFNIKLGKSPKILLKPNLIMPANPTRAVTTHPAVVSGVCKYLRAKWPGAELYLGDSSGCLGLAGTKRAFEVCGLNPVMARFGVKPVPFESQPITRVENPQAKVWRVLRLPKIVMEADLVINLPKLKTHTFTTFTGAVKNLYGCLPGGIKGKGHVAGVYPERFGDLLIDVYQTIKPGLNVMDAIVGMEGSGPTNGRPKRTGYLLASTNAVALDAVALRIAGIKNTLVPTQRRARTRGLFPPFTVVGTVSPIKYQLPSHFRISLLEHFPGFIAESITRFAVQNFMKYAPEIDYNKCTKCYTCVRICPVKAISVRRKLPVINEETCITCLSCTEHCPYGAIHTKKPPKSWINRWLRRWLS